MEILPWKNPTSTSPLPLSPNKPWSVHTGIQILEGTVPYQNKGKQNPPKPFLKIPEGGESCPLELSFAEQIWEFFCWDVRSTLPGEGNVFLSHYIHSSYGRSARAPEVRKSLPWISETANFHLPSKGALELLWEGSAGRQKVLLLLLLLLLLPPHLPGQVGLPEAGILGSLREAGIPGRLRPSVALWSSFADVCSSLIWDWLGVFLISEHVGVELLSSIERFGRLWVDFRYFFLLKLGCCKVSWT